ncbi:hypothetical protein KR059_007331 [Drosophila kikkawai]|nr:hypothetical protein KR059_007331 [Drosophila kikkawai]
MGFARVIWQGAVVLGILCLSILAEYLVPNCGLIDNPDGLRIFNGTDAEINSHPWMAFLHTSTKFICGGSLIHRREKARLGEYDSMTRIGCTVHGCSPKSEEYDIDMAIQKGANDIALLRLSRLVNFNEHIKPICLITDPWKWTDLPYLKDFIATGWGDTKTNRTRGSLQEVTLNRYNSIRCEQRLWRYVQEDQFCAGSPYGDTCNGDSGGPLGKSLTHNGQTRYVQLGVVSYGSPNCDGIGVYTDVIVHMPWIEQVIQRTKDMAS